MHITVIYVGARRHHTPPREERRFQRKEIHSRDPMVIVSTSHTATEAETYSIAGQVANFRRAGGSLKHVEWQFSLRGSRSSISEAA